MYGDSTVRAGKFRNALTEEVTTLADTVGANSAAMLTFEDHKAAEEILGGLRAEPHIVEACVYDSRGNVFAAYRRSGNAIASPPAFRGERAWSLPTTR